MIPPVREFLSACEFLSRRFGWDLSPHDDDLIEALVDARSEAERLVMEYEDEPAALFYACALESPRLGEDYVTLLVVVTLNHANALGRRPVGEQRIIVRELARCAHEIAAGNISFDAFRIWLAVCVPPEKR